MDPETSLPVALPSERVLEGAVVRLEPLTEAHLPALKEIAFGNAQEFRLTSTPTDEAQAAAYFGRVLAQRAQATAHPVAVILKATGRVVGTSRLTEIDLGHRRCELGFSWYDPSLFRSGVNLDAKLLLLSFAFEQLRMHRVQIHTDTRNVRSQRAIESLGATREGVLRRHQVAHDGYVRDTVVYAITDIEWPDVSAQLLAKQAERLRRPKT